MARKNTERVATDDRGSLPTAFCSWSGGKDSCFACFRAMKEYDVVKLVHMAVRNDARTGHDAVDEIVTAQARSMGIPLIRRRVDWDSYETTYRRTLSTVEPGCGVFGNVTGPELRAWVDDLCDDFDLTPIYPLWDGNPVELYRTFINRGFEARVIKIDAERVADRWLGAPLDEEFLEYLLANELHPMGEFGEYHTVTIDGPLFETRIPVRITGRSNDESALIATVEFGD